MQESLQSNTLRFFLIAAAFIVLVAGMRSAADMLVPFLLSIFIAVLATPPLQWLQRRGLPLWLALSIVIMLIVGASLLVVALVSSSVTDFSGSLPEYKNRLQAETAGLLAWLSKYGIEAPTQSIQEYIDPSKAMDLVGKLFNGLGNVLTNAFMILLTVVFILGETYSFPKKLHMAFDDGRSHMQGFERFINNVKQYMAIKTIMSTATGLVVGIWLWILDVDYPLLWGLLAFLLNYVPNIGSIIAAVPAVLLAFVQHGLLVALLSASGYVAANVVIGNVIEPRYMGRGLGLSTLVVFLSLIFWGWIFGPVGMLLSVPLTMFAKIALDSNEDTRWLSILMDSESSVEDNQPVLVANAEDDAE